MNLEDTVEKVLKKNPHLKDLVDGSDENKKELYSIVKDNYKDNKQLVGWAKFNDKANRILGPAEAGLRYLSPLGSVGFATYSAAKILHYGILKLPFSIYYASKTKDWKGTAKLGLSEIAKYLLPFGGVADTLPLYKHTVEKYIIDDSAKKMEKFLETKKQGSEDVWDWVKKAPVVPDKVLEYSGRVGDGQFYIDVPSTGYELNRRTLEDGIEEVYLTKKDGVHANVLTTMKIDLPENTKEIRVPEKGFLKAA